MAILFFGSQKVLKLDPKSKEYDVVTMNGFATEENHVQAVSVGQDPAHVADHTRGAVKGRSGQSRQARISNQCQEVAVDFLGECGQVWLASMDMESFFTQWVCCLMTSDLWFSIGHVLQ